MKKILLFFVFLSSHLVMWATDTMILFNDTDLHLTAVIQDAKGAVLTETVVDAQTTLNWSQDFEDYGYHAYRQPPALPYVVTWYCDSGELYSKCRDVGTNTTVRANSCLGGQRCGGKR
jgi:hypothetical protein